MADFGLPFWQPVLLDFFYGRPVSRVWLDHGQHQLTFNQTFQLVTLWENRLLGLQCLVNPHGLHESLRIADHVAKNDSHRVDVEFLLTVKSPEP